MTRLARPLATLALALGLAAPAAAETPSYESRAVQNRQYFGHHELGVAVGVLPMDAFEKGVTISGSYTLHFDETFAWEVVQAFHAFGVDTGLKADLADFELEPTPFETLETYLMTNFVFKPIYWKGSVLNESLTRGEIMLLVGAGYGWYTRSARPGFDAGVAMRVYLSKLLSVRLDVRYMGFFTTEAETVELENELWIGLGLGFTL